MHLKWYGVSAVLALSAACGQVGQTSPPVERTVSVHGTATVAAKPDRFSFTAGVETLDSSATAAFKSNTAKMQTLIAALQARGITEQQMQTSQFEIDTVPARSGAPRLFKVSNLLTVVRQDPTEVGDLIQASVGAGANDIGSLHFFVADISPIQQRGLEQAFKDARGKGEVLAKESGATLGSVVSMSDQTDYGDNDVRSRLSSLGYIGGRSIAPGTEQMQFAVTVVFALRQPERSGK